MESFLFDDIGCMIQNKAIERIISSMTVQLCHLLISVEMKDVNNKAFASLEKMAEELAEASEEFVQVAERLAEDAEEWFREEMQLVAQSLIQSGRNIRVVAGKLHLQPGCQYHREELVTTAQQILVDTTKVLLLEDAVTARKVVQAAGWCTTRLDALEAADGTTSLRGPWADLAAAMLHLGRLMARGPPERLGPAVRLLRCCVPALLAAARGPVRQPRTPQLSDSRRRVFALIRRSLGELLGRLEPGAAAPAAGAFTRRLQQLRQLLVTPGSEGLSGGQMDAPLAAVVWHCLRLAACSAPPERRHLVARCARLLQLHGAGVRRPDGTYGPLRIETGQQRLDPGKKCAALWAATEALSQGVRAGLLRRILDTFTDTSSPLRSLVHATQATPPGRSSGDGEHSRRSLQLLLAAFQDQAKQMLHVAQLVLVHCPGHQTGGNMEAAMAHVWELVVSIRQLFSQGYQGSGRDWSPAALQDLLGAWVWASERLLACFDDVLDIPEFLRVSIQDMIKHLDFFAWALKSAESREFSRSVAYLQGRATHIVQVMSRFVGQNRDPIFRNGLRVLIRQLEQSASVLGIAAEHGSSGYSSHDTDVFLTMAKNLIYSAQQVQEGLEGTNHPDILSPLRHQVHRFDIGRGWPYFILSALQDPTSPELKYQKGPELGEHEQGIPWPSMERLSHLWIPDIHAQRRDLLALTTSKAILSVESQGHQAVTSAGTNALQQDLAAGAASEAPAGEEPLGSKRTELQEVLMLAPSDIDLTKELSQRITDRRNRLPETTVQLPERTRKSKQALVALAGDWYLLCQQLFCYNPTIGLQRNIAVFMELQQNLALMVQLAAKRPVYLDKKSPDSTGYPEMLLQMQGQLEKTEIHAKQLLDQVLASDGLQAPKSWEDNVEDGCLLWSVAVQDLIQSMERFSKRQSLFLLPLRQAVKDQQGLQEGLAHIADVSQRLQEAARLSGLLCGDEQVKGEVSFQCREVHVVRDALLDVAQILVSSPRPSPSLSTRFDLLCLELTLRAKALMDYLSTINADYEHTFHGAVCPRLSVCKNPQSRKESSLERMVSGIQAVQGIIARDQESESCQEDLLMALESILILTKEVAQRIPGFQEHPEELGLYMLDCLRCEWAAKAHHAVAQLQAWKGGHPKAWRFLAQCLKNAEEPVRIPEQDAIWIQLQCEEGTAGASAGARVDSKHDDASRGSPRSLGWGLPWPPDTRSLSAPVPWLSSSTPRTAVRTARTQSPGLPERRRGGAAADGSESEQEGVSWCWDAAARRPQGETPPTAPAHARAAGGHAGDCSARSLGGSCLLCPGVPKPPPSSSPPLFSLKKELKRVLYVFEHFPKQRSEELKPPVPVTQPAGAGQLPAAFWRPTLIHDLHDPRSRTKDELSTSVRKIAASGQNFTRLVCIIAKNCVDQRCSQELLYMVEQILTVSNQLHIISR
ncbi:uncharacterized protein LOC134471456 [Cavia porcellus]|uniref:uncharacterized protein LOC134471456 n=1 Tax=Cavia porcellus TaxID=10141 RepID=UPI002FDFAAE2